MRGLAIIILIVVFFWLVWPVISRWLKRKAMEKAEDYVRSSMGMPPRDKSKRHKSGERTSTGSQQYYGRNGRNSTYRQHRDEQIIPKEYAEDVDFIEIKDYSQTTIHTTEGKKQTEYHESQISDVEFTEIKNPRGK